MLVHRIRALLLVLAALPGFGAAKPAPDDLLAKAPVFELLLDSSGGSPATQEGFLAQAWPSIEEKLRAMPIGSTVIVASVGDSAAMPMVWRTRVQLKSTRDGASLDAVVRGVRNLVLEFPARIKGKEDKQSHLIAGLFEASRNMNPDSQGNVLILVSDMIEFSPLANCSPPRPCRLPPPQFSLKNVDLHIIGSANRMQPRQAMTIMKAWEGWFRQAGIDLRLYKNM